MKIRLWSVAAAPSACPVDVVFVVDESGSIGTDDFDLMKRFLYELIGYLDVDSGNTRVGLVTYSDSVTESFYLNDYSTITLVQSAVLSLGYSGGSTDTAGALEYVRTTMLTSATGDRSNVPNVVAVLTDGNSNEPADTQVRRMHCML